MVCEFPQAYKHIRNHHVLLKLAASVGVCSGAISYKDIALPLPIQWKGKAKKETTAREAMWRMNPSEREIVKQKVMPGEMGFNIMDAIGIGLWKLKR